MNTIDDDDLEGLDMMVAYLRFEKQTTEKTFKPKSGYERILNVSHYSLKDYSPVVYIIFAD